LCQIDVYLLDGYVGGVVDDDHDREFLTAHKVAFREFAFEMNVVFG
jgi:hypothetical protein